MSIKENILTFRNGFFSRQSYKTILLSDAQDASNSLCQIYGFTVID